MLNSKKWMFWFRNRQKYDQRPHQIGYITHMVSKHMKRCSTLCVIRKLLAETMRREYIPIITVKI